MLVVILPLGGVLLYVALLGGCLKAASTCVVERNWGAALFSLAVFAGLVWAGVAYARWQWSE